MSGSEHHRLLSSIPPTCRGKIFVGLSLIRSQKALVHTHGLEDSALPSVPTDLPPSPAEAVVVMACSVTDITSSVYV